LSILHITENRKASSFNLGPFGNNESIVTYCKTDDGKMQKFSYVLIKVH